MLKGRLRLRKCWPEWIALAAYVGMVAAMIPRHEAVPDEAQAWQLARNLPLSTLFHTYLRYEGSPGLWHLLLHVLAGAHVSFAGLHWICGVVASFGVGLLLFRAPFPQWMKLVLPFTFFLAFQYAIVARSYVLFPTLVFALAATWKSGYRHPWRIAMLLGLMANVSLHCAVISGGFALVFAGDSVRQTIAAKQRQQLLAAGGLLLIFYSFVIWTAWPPHDLWVASHIPVQTGAASAQVAEAAPEIRTNALRVHPREMILGAVAASVLGIASPFFVVIPFWVVLIWFFARRRQLYLMIPLVLFVLFSAVSAFAFWHSGLLAVSLIGVFWISLTLQPMSLGEGTRFPKVVLISLVYAVGCQLAWTVYGMHYDWTENYSPDRAAAEFLRPYVDANARIAVTYWRQTGISAYDAVGILPYFDHNIYVNLAQPFWVWSVHNTTEAEFRRDLPGRPDVVLVEFNELTPYDPRLDRTNPRFALLAAAGYRHVQTFCGAKPAQFALVEYTCHLILDRSGEAMPGSTTSGNPPLRIE